jgi:hypothetical protein
VIQTHGPAPKKQAHTGGMMRLSRYQSDPLVQIGGLPAGETTAGQSRLRSEG